MLAAQVRDTVLKIVSRREEFLRTAAPGAQGSAKTADADSRKPAHRGDASIESVAFAVGVIGNQGVIDLVVTYAEFVHHAGGGHINPIAGEGVGADRKSVLEGRVH